MACVWNIFVGLLLLLAIAAPSQHFVAARCIGLVCYIPGLDFVGRGFDVTTMSPGLQQVTDNSFNLWYSWKDPISNASYLVPEMMFAETITESVQSDVTVNIPSLNDYQAWAVHTTSWSSGFLGMDSHSKTTYQYLHQHINKNKSVVHTHRDILFYKLWAPIPIPQVTTEFKTLVEALPTTFNASVPSNYAKFKQFFHQVGSAIMTEGHFGGRLTTKAWYETCLNDLYDDHWVEEQSGWSFCGIIGDHKGSHSGTHSVSDHFATCSSSTTTVEGGASSSIASMLDWQLWADSIMQRPIPVRYTLKPIHEAISWPGSSGAAATVKEALTQFLQDSHAELVLYEGKLNASASTHHHQSAFGNQHCCKKWHRTLAPMDQMEKEGKREKSN